MKQLIIRTKMKSTVIFDMHLTIFRLNKDVSSCDLMSGKNSNQEIEPMPHAIETLLSFYQQGYKIVIMSSSDVQNSRERLTYLLQEHGLVNEFITTFLKDTDILSMKFFGSKHDTEAWIEAMKPYTKIEYIFEDGESKLHAAGEAAKSLGHNPELFISVADFVSG